MRIVSLLEAHGGVSGAEIIVLNAREEAASLSADLGIWMQVRAASSFGSIPHLRMTKRLSDKVSRKTTEKPTKQLLGRIIWELIRFKHVSHRL